MRTIAGTILMGLIFQGAYADIQTNGIEVAYHDTDGKEQKITVKRGVPKACGGIKVSPDIWDASYTQKQIDPACKKTVVTTIGRISPIKVDGIETVGELEVLEFMKKSKTSKTHLLIDTRFEDWYFKSTIPSAVNIPFSFLNKSKYPDDFIDTMETIGVKINKDGSYDFSNTKTILLFCNGAWCGQSPLAIKNLMAIGYPKNKILWYRGGIQSWITLGLPTVQQE